MPATTLSNENYHHQHQPVYVTSGLTGVTTTQTHLANGRPTTSKRTRMEDGNCSDSSARQEEAVDPPVAGGSRQSRKRKRSSGVSPLISANLTLMELLTYLNVELRDNALAQRFVKNMWDNMRRMTKDVAVRMIRLMYTVPAYEEIHPELIRNQNYMFYPVNNVFGYDQEHFRIDADRRQRTLASAMTYTCKNEVHSLDLVFRQSLKEIADELFRFESKDRVSFGVPPFISSYYLELRLIEKIQLYYNAIAVQNGEDIVRYLSSNVIDEESPLHQHINGSVSEPYIRTLIRRYQLTPDNVYMVLFYKRRSLLPPYLRVWTDMNTQVDSNRTLTTFLQKLPGYEGRPIGRGQIIDMVRNYANAMKPFVAANRDFFAEVCRASELFAWMFFGVVTDDETDGTMHMAMNHYLVKCEQADESGKKNPFIVWNYPLASMYERVDKTRFDDYVNDVVDALGGKTSKKTICNKRSNFDDYITDVMAELCGETSKKTICNK